MFTPDVLPVANTWDTDGDADNASAEEVFAGKEVSIVVTAGAPAAAGTYSDILTFSIGTRK